MTVTIENIEVETNEVIDTIVYLQLMIFLNFSDARGTLYKTYQEYWSFGLRRIVSCHPFKILGGGSDYDFVPDHAKTNGKKKNG